MKYGFIFLIFTLLSMPLRAQSWQEYEPMVNREPARARLIPHHQLSSLSPSSYLRPVEWQQRDAESFEATCNIPFAWANRQIVLRIESAPMGYSLWVAGQRVASVATGELAAEFNLTKYLKEGANNIVLELDTDNPFSLFDDFPNSSVIGRSELISQPTIRIRDVRISTREVEGRYIAEVSLDVKSDALNRKQATIHYELLSPSGEIIRRGTSDLSLQMRGSADVQFTVEIPQKDLWSLDSPTSHRLMLRTQTLGRYTENFELYVGFRTVEMRDGELWLNGVPTPLKAYEVSGELSYADIERIKFDRGCNLLYPLPGFSTEQLYELADEMGMLVLAQTPLCSSKSGNERTKGGNPVNDPRYRQGAIDRALSTYGIAHRHPSVVGFTIGSNSSNGIGLYESFLRLKSIGDPRPIYYDSADGEWNSDRMNFQIVRD